MSQAFPKPKLVATYFNLLLYMLSAFAVRIVAVAPLYLLTLSGPVRLGALLCPVLMLFVVLPLRFSFADAILQPRFHFETAYSFADYGEKLTQSIKHALCVLKWGIPLAALAGVGYYWYSQVDALTVLNGLTAMGTWWAQTVCDVQNLFGAQAVPSVNTLMDGLLVVGLVVGLAVLILLYGAVRNSATRYIWVLATQNEHKPHIEVRRRLMGRRFAQLGMAIVNAVLWAPFVAVALGALKNTVSDLSTTLMMAISTGKMVGLDLASAVLPLVAAFAGLYLPLLPVRRLHTASFAVRNRKGAA